MSSPPKCQKIAGGMIASAEVLPGTPPRDCLVTFKDPLPPPSTSKPALKRNNSFSKLVKLNNRRLSRPRRELKPLERVQASMLMVAHYIEEKLRSGGRTSPPLTRRNSSPNFRK